MRFVSSRMLRSLAAQLLCTYTAALILTAAVITGVVWLKSREDEGVAIQRPLRSGIELIHRNLRFDSAGVPRAVESLPYNLSRVFDDFASDVKYRILDRSGSVILSSESNTAALGAPGQPFNSTLRSYTLVAGGETLYLRMEPIVHGAQTYYIQLAISKRLEGLIRTVSSRMRLEDVLRYPLVSVVLVCVVVYFTLRRVLRPLREASAAAARIDAQNMSKRLPTRNLPVEFLPLVEAFNLTLERLETGYIVQRAFLTSAAHELKTPLALIRAQIDLDGTADREVLLHDIDRMARQVNQLLHLAEASERQNYVFESVDIAAVAEDAADYLRRLAEHREVYVEIRCAPGIPGLQADRGALFMLLKNLLENAIQHSPAGGIVGVTVAANQLCVRDEGPGIAADELPKLFRRFWRGPTRRNEGAGLGLSICAQIAAAHKWELIARSARPGAEFVLSFPGDSPRQAPMPQSFVCDEELL
jgi:two-component system, OmpR family, sensor histidine kinase QseC